MVSVAKVEGGPQVISASVRSTIQSIKEIVGSHSDADIYLALKETGMDPNETTQKLLFQDPFHEVKRKRERKKENSGSKGLVTTDIQKKTEIAHPPLEHTAYPVHNSRRGVPSRNALPDAGSSQAFRVVRDNRVNHNSATNSKPVGSFFSKNERAISGVYVKSSESQKMKSKDVIGRTSEGKEMLEEKNTALLNAGSRAQIKANGSQQHYSSSASVLGVYSSPSDPIHVPSLHPRAASNVGAIRREVGVVGPCRQLDGNAAKQPQGNVSPQISSRPLNVSSGGEGPSKNVISQSSLPGTSANRLLNNRYSNRAHQPMVYQRATQPNMEWKPKASLKPSASAPEKVPSPPRKNNKELKNDTAELEDSVSQLKLSETQNVIIAPHIRVSEIDRCRLIFGSLDAGLESGISESAAIVDGPAVEPSKRTPDVAEESSVAVPTPTKQLDTTDEPIQFSESTSPDSTVVSGSHLVGKIESSDSQNREGYSDIGLVQTVSPCYTPQPLHVENELPSFSGYDQQMGYDSYFRPAIDDTHRVSVMPSSQEVLSSHVANAIPAPSVAMVQQQQQLAQMYPQVHVSHFGNLMPYRQFLSPVYAPMPVPGYSNGPAYHHPSNGNSFVLMPGNNSHVNPSGAVKYGVQQFKPVPTANLNGFGNFTNPTGYAINTNGVVGSAANQDDSSRIKYKDNLYLPNAQPETAEMWMNSRDLQGLQSASYYSMAGQTPHPGTYLTSHGTHASFNGATAVAQSSHMQFPTAMYHHPQQPTAIPNPHLGPTLGANVGVGVPAPPAPGGAYPQPQLGHLNWTGNF